jgi:hypothetical protein
MIETRFKNVKPYSTEELEEMKESIKDCFDEVVIKN